MSNIPEAFMPDSKNTPTKSRLTGQLKRAKAEINLLRRDRRSCQCRPMSERKRHQMIGEICDLVLDFRAENFDQEKLKALNARRADTLSEAIKNPPALPQTG